MIAFLQGTFINKSPANVIINVGGVGYDVNISVNTYTAIAQLSEGLLYTYLHITENAHTLFGFADTNEKNLFIQLISVSGVGASTARMMLSGMKPDELVKAIVQSNTPQLEKIKGIGRKTAERLIVELKEKLAKIHDSNIIGTVVAPASIESDAIDALMALGINRNMAEAAVKKTMRSTEDKHSIESIIKNALKNL